MVNLSKDCDPVGTYNKLKVKKIGPYAIIQKINDNSYLVGLPDEWKITKTFNIKDLFEYYLPDATDMITLNSTESSSS